MFRKRFPAFPAAKSAAGSETAKSTNRAPIVAINGENDYNI